jgi:hypothetical protein
VIDPCGDVHPNGAGWGGLFLDDHLAPGWALFGRSFPEIGEEHFKHQDIQKNDVYWSLITANRSSDNRDYEEVSAHIWLHRFGYDYYSMQQHPNPILLGQTKRIHVIKSGGNPVWPVLPLLGLDALMANNLETHIDPMLTEFRIIKY